MEAQRATHVIRDEPAPPAAAAARRGGHGALRQLIELQDRRLQAAAFFFLWGCSIIIYGIALNPSVNPEHVLAGFVMFTAGMALAFLTLAGAGAGRAAFRMEEALRGFF